LFRLSKISVNYQLIFSKKDFDLEKYLGIVEEVYNMFGSLNDEIVGYLHDVENGEDKEKLEEEKEKLEDEWKVIRDHLKDSDFKDKMKKFEDGVINY